MFDAALLEVVEHLVAGDASGAGDVQRLLQVRRVEIADPPGEDLAVFDQGLEGGDGVLQFEAPAPVQQVAVEPIGLQPLERGLAGGDRALPRGVLRHHLGDQEYRVAPAGDRLADDVLGGAGAIEFRRVDMGHAEVEAAAQRRQCARPPAPLEIPGALADDRHVAAGGAEWSLLHCPSRWRQYRAAGPPKENP